jgi:CheY-like chemotaxis protein
MPSILVVDDDPAIRAMFVRTLAKHGDVDQAASGDEALELLARRRYDAITLDLAMPRVDGFGVLEQLGVATATNHSTPVFVVTANPQDQAMARSFHAGAMFFMTKPVSVLQLSTMVQMAMQQKPSKK